MLSRPVAILLFLTLFYPVTGFAQQSGLARLPIDVTPLHYRLDLDIDPRAERFSGTVSIDVRLARSTQLIRLHGRGLTVTSAHALPRDGNRVNAAYSEAGASGNATLELAQPLTLGQVTLVLQYNAPFDTSLVGLNKVKAAVGGESYAYTQFEPLRARRAFPGFDEPRFKTPFEVSITVHGSDTAVANAPEVRRSDLGDGRRQIDFAPTKPIPTYLVALAVGEFDIVEWEDIPPNTVRKRPLPLRGIAPKGKGKQFTHALKSTASILRLLEEYFDTPYPYAKLDLLAAERSASAGMENVGLILYRQGRILMDDNPSTRQLRGFANLHAHELAHMWFGNLVTPAWWNDLWLNEAFATWMAAKVIHAWQPDEFDGRQVVRSGDRAKWSDRLTTARRIRNPIKTEGDISSAFDSITYSKGGSVLTMIEQYMGADRFRDGLRRFMRRHAHGVATSEDFFAALEQSADSPGVLAAFRSFVDQAGTPRISVDWQCSPTHETTVKLEQSRSFPLGSKGDARRTWSIPLCLSYDDGADTKRHCTLFDTPRAEISLASQQCPKAILPNRDGAAYLNFSLPDHGWNALIERFGSLPPAEALAFMSSVRAAYEAGLISTDRAMAAAASAAASRHWDVSSSPMHMLRDIQRTVVPETLGEAMKVRLREIYAPTLSRFDLSDAALATRENSNERSILRADVLWFMALDAGDPDVVRRLSALGQRAVGYGGDGKRDRAAIHPDLLQLALTVASEDLGVPFMDHLVKHMRQTDDPVFHAHTVNALGYTTKAATTIRNFALILDQKTRNTEASWLLAKVANQRENRMLIFAWMKKNWDAIVAKFPKQHMRWVPWRVKGFCSLAERNQVEAFLRPRMKAHRGGTRQLDYMLEGIDICAAIVAAQQPGAVALLSR